VGEARRRDNGENVLSPFSEFAQEHLPAPPARVLDVGCGQGELTTALAAAGYDVLGIDPVAPHGDRFRRLKLEDLDDAERFDAVVASYALHHLRDLEASLDKVAGLLSPGGTLLVDEFGWDRLDEPTLDWLYGQRRALAAAGQGESPGSRDELWRDWQADYAGLHGFAALRSALDARFDERTFEWVPFLHRKLKGFATEVLEQALIDGGALTALGFRYVGVVRQR
jgi:SAM-dependent methyltransferase